MSGVMFGVVDGCCIFGTVVILTAISTAETVGENEKRIDEWLLFCFGDTRRHVHRGKGQET